MKVKHNDPDLLIVEERPWFLGVIFGGGALVLFWAGMVRLIALELAGFAYIAIGLFLLFFLYLVRAPGSGGFPPSRRLGRDPPAHPDPI